MTGSNREHTPSRRALFYWVSMLRQQRSKQCFSLFVTTLLCHLTAALSRPASLTQDISSLQVNVTTLNTSGEWVEVRLLIGKDSALSRTPKNAAVPQAVVFHQLGIGRHEQENVV